jgi:hypothetical protein
LGGLLLALIDCDAASRELGHTHAPELVRQAVHAEPGTPEAEHAEHAAGACHSYDVAASVERRPQPPPLTAATVAVVIDPAAGATPSPTARPAKRRAERAVAGRSRLTVLCTWRI